MRVRDQNIVVAGAVLLLCSALAACSPETTAPAPSPNTATSLVLSCLERVDDGTTVAGAAYQPSPQAMEISRDGDETVFDVDLAGAPPDATLEFVLSIERHRDGDARSPTGNVLVGATIATDSWTITRAVIDDQDATAGATVSQTDTGYELRIANADAILNPQAASAPRIDLTEVAYATTGALTNGRCGTGHLGQTGDGPGFVTSGDFHCYGVADLTVVPVGGDSATTLGSYNLSRDDVLTITRNNELPELSADVGDAVTSPRALLEPGESITFPKQTADNQSEPGFSAVAQLWVAGTYCSSALVPTPAW